MEKNKISIILPVYNAGLYLGKCLSSLVNQTYHNIEILCFNDGSKDNSLQILREFSKRDDRIVVYDEPNQGIASIRNKGMARARGEYLMFSDADDWWELNACEKALNTILQYNADVVLFSYYREYKNKTLTRDNIFSSDFVLFEGDNCTNLWRSFAGLIGSELKYPENFDSNNALWSKLYKTEIFKSNQEVRYVDNKTIGAGGDGLLNFMYFKHVKKAVFISDHLYHYRKTNEESIVTKYKPDFVKKRFHLFELYQEYIDKNNLCEDFSMGLSNRIAVSIIGLGLHEMSSTNSFKTKFRNIKEILNNKRFSSATQRLDITHMPKHWYLFFLLSKYKCTLGICLMLDAILFLKSKK